MRQKRLSQVSRLSQEFYLRRLNSQFHNELALHHIDRAISCLNRIYCAEGGMVTVQVVKNSKFPVYCVTESASGRQRYVSSLSRALWLYKQGFSRRCSDISSSYCLNRIKYTPGDIVLDVGANYGDLKLYLDSVNTKIRYIAFEPSEIDYYCLMLNHGNEDMIKQNLNLYLQTALGNRDGDAEFYDDTKSASSSLLPVPGAMKRYTVDVKCLDTVVGDHSLSGKYIKLLKLEAEGLEPEVCRGMVQTLPYINYIAADLGCERGMEQETTAPEVINFLLLNNFQLLDVNLKDGRFLFANSSFMSES